MEQGRTRKLVTANNVTYHTLFWNGFSVIYVHVFGWKVMIGMRIRNSLPRPSLLLPIFDDSSGPFELGFVQNSDVLFMLFQVVKSAARAMLHFTAGIGGGIEGKQLEGALLCYEDLIVWLFAEIQ